MIRVALLGLVVLATPPAVASATDDVRSSDDTLSSRLNELAGKELRFASAADQAEAVSLPARGPASLMRDGGALIVDLRVASRTRERLDAIEGAGAEVVHVSPEYRTVTVSVPERSLKALAGIAGVEAATEVLTPMTSAGDAETAAISTCAGSVTSEADAQLKAATARTQFNVDGAGVKVGVLSDSYDTKTTGIDAADDVATGDLPGPGNPCGRTAPVQVLDDSQPAGSDEGRAMMQLVHDLAPGSPLAFATAFTSETAFADNIRALAAAGSKVIVDDVTYFDEPFFQDGPVAVAVNDVTAAGAAYYSSAANNNIISGGNDVASFEAPAFRDAAVCPPGAPPFATNCMDFNPTGVTDTTYGITVPAGRSLLIDLQWAQPWNGVTTDLDAYLINAANTVVASSQTTNRTTQKPFELVSFQNATDVTQNLSLAINRCDTACDAVGGGDSATPRIKFVFVQAGSGVVPTEYTVSSGGDVVGPSIFGHNGAANAMSTAAVPFNNSATAETFSSRGPVNHYFGPVSGVTPAPALGSPQTLAKPDIAATDGARTTFFTPFSPGVFRFFGTSAAAPHAAAVAALQFDANPSQSLAQLTSAQKSTADPVGAFGPTVVGSGLIDALGAVPANPPAPPSIGVESRGATTNPAPPLGFTVSGDPRTVTCSLDGSAATGCVSPFTPPPSLPDGVHTLTVRAADYFGGAGEGSGSFTVDTTGPATEFDKTPKNKTFKRKARFAFSSEPGATFVCALDRKPFKPCSERFKKRVRPGKHKFRVQATDALGNVGPPERDRWKVKKP